MTETLEAPVEQETHQGLPDIPAPAAADEYATFEDLLNKPARERDVTLTVSGKAYKLHLRAIGAQAYDQLIAACPPSPDDRERGAIWDAKTFGPKLIAACVTRPRLDYDQAARLWADPNWSGGEAGGLFMACVNLCQSGLDVPFNASG